MTEAKPGIPNQVILEEMMLKINLLDRDELSREIQRLSGLVSLYRRIRMILPKQTIPEKPVVPKAHRSMRRR